MCKQLSAEKNYPSPLRPAGCFFLIRPSTSKESERKHVLEHWTHYFHEFGGLGETIYGAERLCMMIREGYSASLKLFVWLLEGFEVNAEEICCYSLSR